MLKSNKSRKLFECERAFTSTVGFAALLPLRCIRSHYTTAAMVVILEPKANINANAYMEPGLYVVFI